MARSFKMKKQVCLIAWYCILGVSLPACDEQLPPLTDPVFPFSASIDALYYGARDLGHGASDNTLKVYFSVRYPRGAFDETLQGDAELVADLQLVWTLHPEHKRNVTLDKKSIVENRRYKYDPQTNILLMDPGDEMSFFYEWDFVDNDSVDITSMFPLVVDSTCVHRDTIRTPDTTRVIKSYPRMAASATFIITGKAKLFRQFAVYYGPAHKVTILYENAVCR